MKRIPIMATLLVAIAILTMVMLGVWQLQRKEEKQVLLAIYAANLTKPAMAFPELAPIPQGAMFRRTSAQCLHVKHWIKEGGRAQSGRTGYRQIAQCSTGAEGPGILVDMGVTPDPQFQSKWAGGQVNGWITTEPEHSSLFGRLFTKPAILRPLLISDQAAPGLEPTQPPAMGDIPNNHLAYAVQWFLFAGIAGVIYILAIMRRRKRP